MAPASWATSSRRTPFHSAGAPPAAILYGASKIIGEQLCRDAHRKRGLDYVVLRYSTVYGERQHYRAANALYIIETHDRVRRGERPRVIGDGSETKHFVHVSDVGPRQRGGLRGRRYRCRRQHLRARAGDHAGNRAAGDGACGQGLRARARRARPGQGAAYLRRRLAHRSRRPSAAIGWRPQVDMREGIRRLIAWREAAESDA